MSILDSLVISISISQDHVTVVVVMSKAGLVVSISSAVVALLCGPHRSSILSFGTISSQLIKVEDDTIII